MLATVTSVYTLLLGMGILLVGSGLLGMVVGLRAELEQFSGSVIGIIMSAFFFGYVLGSYWCPVLIRRFGHIRAFTAMAALAAASVLVHALIVDPIAWFVLRVITGICMLGLYMVIESWLNEQVDRSRRGKVFAVYMTVNLVALGLSQFLILVYGPAGMASFLLVAMLFSLGLIPIALTNVREPSPVEAPSFSLGHMFRMSPLGVVGGFASGLVNGAFWGMGPVFAHRIGMDAQAIAIFMSGIILGGALLQFPIGHYSDRYDRRAVLTYTAIISAGIAAAAVFAAQFSHALLIAVAILYGGFSFSVYSLSVAHFNDQVEPGEILEATRGLLLLNGMGAALGPALAGGMMQVFGPRSLLAYWAIVLGLLGAFALWRMRAGAPVPAEAQGEFVPMSRTSAAALEMDPRVELEPELDLGPQRAG